MTPRLSGFARFWRNRHCRSAERRRNILPGAMLGSAESARNRPHRPDARKEQDWISYRLSL